ncbi:hypothetical protein [Deinococcus multiflagellatus]|uniref:Uncharacterized protein n=1 Tax=Deinococcus multiflagellatus TaxID=1656887 RepID=A0ABW1ZVB7_9DEIO|nr:hypothetical protein [Deinococcus multiflagellatus]MBZ9714495.1 hypothetical protein [Deinococcus multiflagellatus]
MRRYVDCQRPLLRALKAEFGDRPTIRDALSACDHDLSQLSMHLLRTTMIGPPVDP